METEGTIKRILFQNSKNGFCVAVLGTDDGKELRIIGTLGAIQSGDRLRVVGELGAHPRHGAHLKVKSFSLLMPHTPAAMRQFLSSGRIPGIGKKTAELIVGLFGDKTFEVLDNNPQQLQKVPTIGKKKLQRIIEGWNSLKAQREQLVALQSFGLSSSMIEKALVLFGDKAVVTIRQDPYSLTRLSGIGFVKADSLARNMGIAPESPQRVSAGILYVFHRAVEEGHCFVKMSDLVDTAVSTLGVSTDVVQRTLLDLFQKGALIKLSQGFSGNEETVVYRPDTMQAETAVVTAIRRLQEKTHPLTEKCTQINIEAIEKELNIRFSEEQQAVLREVQREKVLIVTGGPGTGKTTVIRGIISLLRKSGVRFMLAAPTGRAAKRMQETTGVESKTLHRLLEYNPATHTFLRNSEKTLECDVLIVDEVSMIDIFLFKALMKALSQETVLILVGDEDQLPSVGPGSVLHDLISSRAFKVVRLEEIFRQAAQSLIITNAHRVNRGEMLILPQINHSHADFYFISRSNADACAHTICYLVSQRIPKAFAVDPKQDIQVLSPMHKGDAGTQRLNRMLQDVLNPTVDGTETPRSNLWRASTEGDSDNGSLFRRGDKVMQLRNNYEKGQQGIFNGDIGVVTQVNDSDGSLTIRFDEQTVLYDRKDWHELTLAYAITVHKSQGSEYPVVVMPLVMQHYMMLERKLLYTALTRAKKLFILVGDEKAVSMAIRNNAVSERNTGLAARLQVSDVEVG